MLLNIDTRSQRRQTPHYGKIVLPTLASFQENLVLAACVYEFDVNMTPSFHPLIVLFSNIQSSPNLQLSGKFLSRIIVAPTPAEAEAETKEAQRASAVAVISHNLLISLHLIVDAPH